LTDHGGGKLRAGMAQKINPLTQANKNFSQLFAYCAHMPARSLSNKSEPIAFACPVCEAKYIIVTIEVPAGVQHSKFSCVKCDAFFPVGQGRVSLEYILLDGDANE
jgi:transcription elongation factor Elf1